MKIICLILLIISSVVFNSCNEEGYGQIIEEGDVLEFRENFPMKNRYKKLIIIEPGTEFFIEVKDFINEMNSYEEVEKVDDNLQYTIRGNNLKIFISYHKVYIEKKTKSGKIIKLFKEHIPRSEREIKRIKDKFKNKYKSQEWLNFKFLTNSNNWIYDFGNIYGKGKLKESSYTFCGLSPVYKEYEYKVGEWKFWNLKRKLIAEGSFRTENSLVDNNGGCEYNVITSKIDDDWSFYIDNNVDQVSLIYDIEHSKRLTYFKGFLF